MRDDGSTDVFFVAVRSSQGRPHIVGNCRTNSTNLPDGQITSDFQKWCQAPKSKIFCFAPDPNQFTDSHRLVPTRGADRASSRNAGRDAVDAAASGEQQRAGRMTPKRTAKSCCSDAPMLA